MKTQLNTFQLALTMVVVIACGLILISYGWISFSTFTERPGLNGDLYYYYRVDRKVFGLYKLLIATVAFLTIIRLSFLVFKGDRTKITKTFIYFAIFVTILIFCEIYLSTRFVGKG